MQPLSAQIPITDGRGVPTFQFQRFWQTMRDAAEAVYSVKTATTDYTETASKGEVVVKCDNASGFTVTLPNPAASVAKLVFKKMQAAGTITISGAIDGGSSATLTTQYSTLSVVSDGSSWLAV